MKRTYFLTACGILASAASFADSSSPCDRIQIIGMYSNLSQEAQQIFQAEGGVSNPLKAKKTENGYEFDVIQLSIPVARDYGEEVGSYGTVSLKASAENPYCVASLTRNGKAETYRIAMAPSGDLILSRLDQNASDGSIVPALILYKQAQ